MKKTPFLTIPFYHTYSFCQTIPTIPPTDAFSTLSTRCQHLTQKST